MCELCARVRINLAAASCIEPSTWEAGRRNWTFAPLTLHHLSFSSVPQFYQNSTTRSPAPPPPPFSPRLPPVIFPDYSSSNILHFIHKPSVTCSLCVLHEITWSPPLTLSFYNTSPPYLPLPVSLAQPLPLSPFITPWYFQVFVVLHLC